MKTQTRTATFDGEQLSVTFTQTFERWDGEWIGNEDYDILTCEVLGVAISPFGTLRKAIIDLARDIEEWRV